MNISKLFSILIAISILDAGCSDDHSSIDPEEWRSVFDQPLDRSILSVVGNAADDVYFAGGGLGAGPGSLALHFNGQAWRELDVGTDATLWWVWPDPESSTQWWVGEQGTIIRGNGTTFEQIPSNTNATLFGVWGAAANDVWVVGGEIGLDGEKDVLFHWNGQTLERVTDLPQRGATLFKVWGIPGSDLWIVGQGGTILRRQSTGAWDDLSLSSPTSLLTVHGCSPDEIYAVGGQLLLHYDGAAWTEIPDVEIFNTLNGVSCGEDTVLVVGNGAVKLRYDRQSGQWFNEQFKPPATTDFHAAYVAPGGDLWATGGNFLTPPTFGERTGIIGYRGNLSPPPNL
jgi:hypothetical protein